MSSSAGHGVALSRTKVCEGKESFANTEGTRLVRPRAKTNEVNKIKRNLEKRYIYILYIWYAFDAFACVLRVFIFRDFMCLLFLLN